MRLGLLSCLLGVISWATLCLGARILVVLPFPGKSHHLFATAIVTALAKRGHHVVEYSPYPPKTPIPNHTHVEIHTRTERELGHRSYEDYVKLPEKYKKNLFGFKIKWIWEINRKICEDTLEDNKIQQLLKSDSKFDIIMIEASFGQESLLALGHRFSAPTVNLETFFPWVIVNWISGNSLSIASIPDLFSKLFDNEVMSFKDRLLNGISVALTLTSYHHNHLPYHDQLVKRYFPHHGTPSVSAMIANISLHLTNSHPQAVNYVQPYTPNIVPVGGLHIPPEKSPLPQEIQNFLDDANEGFILFSLGTVVPMHIFPEKALQIFINTFERLPLKVLWKINLDRIENLPKNVMITKWMPQLEVLVHPNCQLFITHGGLFSHHEAIYAGVPTVGIPFFADQPYNLQFNAVRGRGITLDFSNLDEHSLYSAITTVTNNSRYKDAANRDSRIYRSQAVPPLDSAVFWVEYVLRHGGAHHLKPASTQMSWYQIYLLDVLGAILVVFTLLVLLLLSLVKWLLKLGFPVKEERNSSHKKKNN